MAEKTYFQKFEQIFNFTRSISDICGVDVIKTNYRVCKKTVFVWILINLAIGFTFYTMYIEVVLKANLYNMLKSVSVLGTGIQGYTKLVNVIQQQEKLRFLYNEMGQMYRTYDLQSPTYKKCLEDNISLVKKLLVTLFTIIVLTTVIVVGVPIVMLVVMKRRVEVLPFQFPIMNNGSDLGYHATFFIHIVCVLFGAFGNFCIDSWLFIYVANIPLMKNILKCKFNDLDAIKQAAIEDPEETRGQLRDIFQLHQSYIGFRKIMTDSYFWVIFVQISTEFFGIVCTIICIFLGIWPPAPAYLLYLFAMVYAYCSLGNLVEISNDNVTAMIYDCCWYNLTVKEQKMILIMLRESQQASGISIGNVAPLSLNTALQLTKTIYTFSMMLKEFLN